MVQSETSTESEYSVVQCGCSVTVGGCSVAQCGLACSVVMWVDAV